MVRLSLIVLVVGSGAPQRKELEGVFALMKGSVELGKGMTMVDSARLVATPALVAATAILSVAKEQLASACAAALHFAPVTLRVIAEEVSQLLVISSFAQLSLLALQTLMGFVEAAGKTFAAAFGLVERVAEQTAASVAELGVARTAQVVADRVLVEEHTPAAVVA